MEDFQTLTPSWFYTKKQLRKSPSRQCGLRAHKELIYRQQAALLILDMGRRLQLSRVTVSTAIVYMQRFYMVQSFTKYNRYAVATAALFLACKVEEQPHLVADIITACHACLYPKRSQLHTQSRAYPPTADEILQLEIILFKTFGLDIVVEHPYETVAVCASSVNASEAVTRMANNLATGCLMMTTFCLQYKPQVIACACIYLAAKRQNFEIPLPKGAKSWWESIDKTLTKDFIEDLAGDLLHILSRNRLRLRDLPKDDKPVPKQCNREDMAMERMHRYSRTDTSATKRPDEGDASEPECKRRKTSPLTITGSVSTKDLEHQPEGDKITTPAGRRRPLSEDNQDL